MAGERDAFNRLEPELKFIATKENKGGVKMYSVLQQILDDGHTKWFNRGVSDGIKRGRAEGENAVTSLFAKLRAAGKNDELDKALADRAYLKKLMDEYQK